MLCPICLDEIMMHEINTSCGHHYHQSCLEEWLVHDTKKQCPVCRQAITYGIMIRQTRSRTAPQRTRLAVAQLHYWMELFHLSLRENDRRRLVHLMLQKIYKNRKGLKNNRPFWSYLLWFKKNALDENEYYIKLLNQWKIKFYD